MPTLAGLAQLSITPISAFLLPAPEFMQISLLTRGQYEPLSRHSFRTVQQRKERSPKAPKDHFSKADFGGRQGCQLSSEHFGSLFFFPGLHGSGAREYRYHSLQDLAPPRESRPKPRPSGPRSARSARPPRGLGSGSCCSGGRRRARGCSALTFPREGLGSRRQHGRSPRAGEGWLGLT